ncbi:hypothetical protein [Clostridium sp. 001]|uniref:hypothetical protein n=1 Tax=Clostridium sp. 001 TaxID=1970093 RepID=UPI001C2BFCAA|nr:hypothetical protein [Clostridium sp. 001]QXE20031.1 hypothetical protein B5S50_15025 [Clostridium sp. 001]
MGVIQEKLEKQLKHLDDVIINKNYWYNDKFRVMNNEAASGKSVETKKSIAKLATTTDKKIIYIQMFAHKDSKEQDTKELEETVNDINKYAGKNISGYLCSKNQNLHKKILSEKQVICITHKRYLEICKNCPSGNLISNSDVMIIDEFPNLFESFYISELELTRLQGFTLITDKEKSDIEEMVSFINGKLNELENKYGKSEMKIINLQKLDIKKYIKVLQTIIEKAEKDNIIAHKITIDIAKNVIELFSHSSVYTIERIGSKKYPMLYSFHYVDYILAKENNVILDANGAFDMRYKLRPDLFKLDNQSKVFDYSNSTINMYPIPTTKTALKKYKNILLDVCNHISNLELPEDFCSEDEHLIVADIDTEDRLTDFQKETYNKMYSIFITHFGALIGKNDWKNYNNAWIIKTPYYSWIQYILQYLFYSNQDLNGNTSCEIRLVKGTYSNYTVFKNNEFNKFKNSIVLGEYYQALKRIARDGRKCTFNVFLTDECIFKLLITQFKNIKAGYKNDVTIDLYVKKESKKEPKNNERIEQIKDYILQAKNNGKNKIKKNELCTTVNLRKDKLSRQLRSIQDWMNKNNIKVGMGKEQAYILIA